ncbi:MAG: DegV family protein [Eubacteriales bacterium]|nr:DegV family protein [Eubacteriales bacterium]
MKKVAIVADSNSGITKEEALRYGIYILPTPFFIDEQIYMEGIDLTQEMFFEKLEQDAQVSTSQPSPAELMDLWDEVLKENDELVYICLSSGLSTSCGTAVSLSRDDKYEGRVFPVNNQRVSVTQYQSVMDAVKLRDRGWDGAKIRDYLEETKMDSSIYITLETLKYLKKGGRVTPTAAAIGTILNLKPVLQIQGEKLDAYAKARGKIKAKKLMLDAMHQDFEGRFAELCKNGEMSLHAAYAGNQEEAEGWKKEIEEAFPEMEVHMSPLSLTISCHIGAGALAIACARKVV